MGFRRGSGDWYPRIRLGQSATALALLCLAGIVDIPRAEAQSLDGLNVSVGPADQLLLEADTLVYDNVNQTVTAEGSVRIDYGGNRMVARRVIYNQTTGRLVADGDVEIVDRDGNRISSDHIDVTDDFRDGFINALSVETAEKTYFGAESAERKAGTVTTFVNGVYTACEPCEDKPDKAPIWRIKSRKIIWNKDAKTIRFQRPRFEFFGLPIAQLPAFEMADPSVKRKSGFLFPGIGFKSELGASVTLPYFFAFSPTYDLTVKSTYYTRQGFLAEADWRQKFNSGEYSLKIAGISQNEPTAFKPGYVDRTVKTRLMAGSKGKFTINPRWTFGWDVLVQSDPNFANTYLLDGYSEAIRRNEVYLTGLNDRNYFDLRFYKFQVQEALPASHPSARDPRQPWVLPSFDYAYTVDEPVAGGELSFDVNTQIVGRTRLDFLPGRPALPGMRGWSGRVTAEAEWKKTIVTSGGLLVTPLLHARADGIGVDAGIGTNAAIAAMAGGLTGAAYTHDGTAYGAVAADIRSSYFRAMATAGLEARWPILFSTSSATHVLEPMAQLFVRPDVAYGSTLGIPNEDAQSLVFDASTLFERDKFSGYDLIESGTRANLGLRYSASFANGWTANAIVGQSYHLAGRNPFAAPELVNVGAYSGLETDVSDVVAMAGFTSPGGVTFTAGGRFDEQTLEVRRAEASVSIPIDRHSINASYTFIQAQPLYGFSQDRREVTLGGRARLHDYWSVYASGTYDLESSTLANSSFGFLYDDECFTYGMTFSRTQNTISRDVSYGFGFNISFRTLGDFGTSTSTNAFGTD